MPATPRRPGIAVAMAPLSEALEALEALELALLEDSLARLEALLDSLEARLEALLETELAEDEADEPPVMLLMMEPVGGEVC